MSWYEAYDDGTFRIGDHIYNTADLRHTVAWMRLFDAIGHVILETRLRDEARPLVKAGVLEITDGVVIKGQNWEEFKEVVLKASY